MVDACVSLLGVAFLALIVYVVWTGWWTDGPE
jgi:hypothetical protein